MKKRTLIIAVAALALLSTPFILVSLSGRRGDQTPAVTVPDAVVRFGGWDVQQAMRLSGGRLGIVDGNNSLYTLESSAPSAMKVLALSTPGGYFVSDSVAAQWNADGANQSMNITDIASGRVLFAYPSAPTTFLCMSIAANEPAGLVAWLEEGYESASGKDPESANILRVVNVKTGKPPVDIAVLKGCIEGFDHWETALAFSADGATVAYSMLSDANRGVIGAADVKTGKLLWEKSLQGLDGVSCLAFHPDGKSIFTGSPGQVLQRDTATGSVIATPAPVMVDILVPMPFFRGLNIPFVKVKGDRLVGMTAIDVSPDGKYVAVGADGELGVAVFDLATWKEVKRIRTAQSGIVQTVLFSPDSRGIWSAGFHDKDLRYYTLLP